MKKIFFLFILLSMFISAYADTNSKKDTVRYSAFTLTNTQVIDIYSQNVKQDYKIYVDIPASYYDHPDRKYPAIFLLDADYSFPIAKAVVEHLSDRERIPEMFVIGIAYGEPNLYRLNRTRDYTPIFFADGGYSEAIQKVSGGANNFALFIQTELLPSLEKQYRLSNQRTLVGHSYGGLFESWLVLTYPKLFQNYIIVSPSLWYGDNYIFKVESKYAKANDSLPARIFFAVGEKENAGTHPMVSELDDFTAQIKHHGYTDLNYEVMVSEPDDHDTIFPEALTQGLLYLFAEPKKG